MKRLLGGVLLFLPLVASAHAFGQQFNLPLPVSYFINGGMLAFVASFLALLFFSTPTTVQTRKNFSYLPISFFTLLLSALGLATFLFVLWTGFFGVQDFTKNPVPDLFWIGLLLLCVYLSALIGGWWEFVNPFKTIARFFGEKKEEESLLWFLPPVFFFGLIWLELFSNGLGAIPNVLATVLLFYALFCLSMTRIYGIDWFERGDFFSVLFNTIGKLAPLQLTKDGLEMTYPGSKLIHERIPHFAVLFFVLILLSATVVDGLSETTVWWEVLSRVLIVFPHLYWFEIIVTVAMPFALLAGFALAIFAMKLITKSPLSIKELMLRFGYSLVPIAFVYHFAHYFSLIPTQLFSYIPPADMVWYIQLTVIVLGHIAAAVVAHRISQYTFDTKFKVRVSQLPMLVLMVLFTSFGLWTLAQPFVQVQF